MPQNEQSAFVQAISTNKGQSATLSEKQDCGETETESLRYTCTFPKEA